MGSYSLKRGGNKDMKNIKKEVNEAIETIKGNILKVLKKEDAPMQASKIRSNLGLDKIDLPKDTQEGWITWTLLRNLKEEGKIRQIKPRGKWELDVNGSGNK